ncbi:TPA: T6SS effector BTH_I2691 family protein [Enterobacter hormaechei]
MKAQANKNAAASQQAASTPSGCKSCERKGVPILPLRVAVMLNHTVRSDWHPSVPKQDVELTGGEFKYGLRTLRMGYLYVLLDNSIWEGYEVTAEGYLRYFNAYEMPESGTVAPLSSSCRQENHDIKCSFLHIDNHTDRTVWLAFSSDAWSPEVLKGYQNGDRPDSRFTRFTVSKEGKVTADGALVIDHSLSSLTQNVAEYATEFFPSTAKVDGSVTGGAHGFYSRKNTEKLKWLSSYINQLTEEYQCPVMAVPVDDAVGVVQELNVGRLMLLEEANEYLEQPGVFHKHMISEAITWYLGVLKKGIAKKSQPRTEATGPALGGYGPKIIPKEQVADETFASQYARILKSYDEPKRAAFDEEFDSHFSTPMARFDAIDKDLAAWYQNPLWKMIIEQDYAPSTCPSGWAWQMLTVAACVQGGALGEATDKVWGEHWLNTATSPAYLGFTGMQTSLMKTLFSGGNIYADLKTGTTSDEFANILKNAAIQRSFTTRLVALSGSMSRPGIKISADVRKGYMAMTQGAMLTAGQSTVVVTWHTTLRKLKQRLRSDAALRQSVSKNNATFEVISKQLGLKEAPRGGGALVVDELMGIHGKALDTPLRVEFSTPGTVEEIRAAFPQINHAGSTSGNLSALGSLDEVFISEMSLQGKELKDPIFRASYAQMAKLNERTMRIVSGDGFGMMMGTGLMALQVVNMKGLGEQLRQSVGTDVDVAAGTAINTLLFIEAMAEMSGFASKLALKLNWVVLKETQQVPGLVKFGGVLAGIASIVDGIRNGLHAREAYKTRDSGAAWLYGISAGTMISGGIISGVWARAGVFALLGTESFSLLGLGPVGLATLLILTGMALAYEASELRSTAFEIWLRRTCFGIPNGAIDALPVWHTNSLEDMGEALMGIRAIAGGMVGDVAFASSMEGRGLAFLESVGTMTPVMAGKLDVNGTNYRRVDIRVSIPGWVAGSGGWLVQLTGGGKTLFSESVNAPGVENHYQHCGPEGYYLHDWWQTGVAGDDGREKAPWCLNLKVSLLVPESSTPEVTLNVAYWPDSQDAENKLGITINAKQG